MKRYNGIKLKLGISEDQLKFALAKILGVSVNAVKKFAIAKKSLDARNKNDIFYIYNVDYSLTDEPEQHDVLPSASGEAVVIGSGPCGLFCALYLARCGVKPIVFERGSDVDRRAKSIDGFISSRVLDTECNVQFGEGGAGTFSDGKLNTAVHNELIGKILKDFVSFGAPAEIVYDARPHIGSDVLPSVVKSIRNEILRLGGKIYFDTKVTDFIIEKGSLKGIVYERGGVLESMATDCAVLAIGHSSRDTFEKLDSLGVSMEQKAFAAGFRIEHLQNDIGFSQYGKVYATLPPADYKLVSHIDGRGVFTFCMCPGGFVMPAASEKNRVAVNGMSRYKRDGVNANSAVVCEIRPEDFGASDALAGVRFQRDIEEKAFVAGGGGYKAPVQLVGDFIKNRQSSRFLNVFPTYPLGTEFYPLEKIYKKEVTNCIIGGIMEMNRRLKGFSCDSAVLTGVESRTSSPLRILRKEDRESVNVAGLFPAGEGAGYAGGIMSAASDGIKTALAIVCLKNSLCNVCRG